MRKTNDSNIIFGGFRMLTVFAEDGCMYCKLLVYRKTKTGKLKKAKIEKWPYMEKDYAEFLYGKEICAG